MADNTHLLLRSNLKQLRLPAMLAEFAPHHARLSTSPDSGFVQTLVVQLPADDRIVTLRARTLFVDGPGLGERHVIDDTPVRVEYGLTDKGHALEPVVRTLKSWANNWL